MTIDEATKVLEEQGYLVEFFPFKGKKKEQEKPAESEISTFKRKKKEQEKPDEPEFLYYRNTSPYAGLTWRIREQLNIDYNGSITKEQAIGFIKCLLPAIKDNPTSQVYEKVLFEVIDAIK